MLEGKVHITSFVISLFIAGLEELLFRYYVLQIKGYPVILLLFIGGLCFGLVHIKFSKYDVFSKSVLGIICGVIFLLSHHILFPIIFHGTYNFLTLKRKQTYIGRW